ncbi:GNAT family N-acetyltransferase [Rhodococcus sp. H29-C3]|uniref:GNAT family N-acetyltransferase n=1 Tax=Rhodococcus sp. H29-C3 TaxID=3046307 RepID=UPI0024BB0253|nr:GNAT family N-acetyltransferase [Rhodococcus sp. H29-C3]MDJ0361912.1 GNAT family N-acetyltransferase [Rhodococcus sp. H29-C3]
MESVVPLSPKDAGELFTLQRAAYVTEAQAHEDLNLPPLVESLTEVTNELDKPEVDSFGLRDGAQRLVGAVRVRVLPANARCAEVGRLVVAPDVQGRGLGSRLLELVEERLSEDITELKLFTGEHSVGNLRLYSRFSYRETHRVPTANGYALVYLSKRLR